MFLLSSLLFSLSLLNEIPPSLCIKRKHMWASCNNNALLNLNKCQLVRRVQDFLKGCVVIVKCMHVSVVKLLFKDLEFICL